MPGVTEIYSESFCPLRGPAIVAGLVAGAARRDVAIVRLSARRMARETGLVRAQSRRYGKGRAAPFGLVTGGASDASVPRVIELHIESLQRRERLHLWLARFDVRMTDRADRAAGIGELLRVTARARRVPCRANRLRRVVLATVT